MDRRKEPRTNRDSSIKCRVLHSDTYKEGRLVQMSANGALLWLAGEYSVGTSIEVLMQTNDKLEHVYMCVVRIGETNPEGYTGYGCKVEMTLSEAA